MNTNQQVNSSVKVKVNDDGAVEINGFISTILTKDLIKELYEQIYGVPCPQRRPRDTSKTTEYEEEDLLTHKEVVSELGVRSVSLTRKNLVRKVGYNQYLKKDVLAVKNILKKYPYTIPYISKTYNIPLQSVYSFAARRGKEHCYPLLDKLTLISKEGVQLLLDTYNGRPKKKEEPIKYTQKDLDTMATALCRELSEDPSLVVQVPAEPNGIDPSNITEADMSSVNSLIRDSFGRTSRVVTSYIGATYTLLKNLREDSFLDGEYIVLKIHGHTNVMYTHKAMEIVKSALDNILERKVNKYYEDNEGENI